jgi:uncharacterized OB-fold protein
VNTRSIDPHLFHIEPAMRLMGGRERGSGRLAFPLPNDPESFDPAEMPRYGYLWSFTVQRFTPKSPPYLGDPPFAPFAIGYVELPGALIIESRLTDVDFGRLHIGMPMELTALPLYTDADGTQVVTYAFRPQESARS